MIFFIVCYIFKYFYSLRSQFSTIDEDHENEDRRRRLKKESELIVLNKGKLEAAQSFKHCQCDTSEECSNECLSAQRMGEERCVSGKQLDHSLSNSGVLNLDDSVDSMLENVNRIMCQGTEISKDGGTVTTVKPLEDDAIKMYVLKTQHEQNDEYLEKTGIEHCISPHLSAHLKSTTIPHEETVELILDHAGNSHPIISNVF